MWECPFRRRSECPFRKKKLIGDELYFECGYDGEERLCVEDYDPVNPCVIHLFAEEKGGK